MRCLIVPNPAGSSPFYSVYNNAISIVRNHRNTFDEFLFRKDLYSIYGPVENWFDVKTADSIEDGQEHVFFNSGLIPYPSDEDFLAMNSCVSLLPYNERILQKINAISVSDRIGVHFRGTDGHHHVDRIPLDVYFDEIRIQSDKYKTNRIFLCTDEVGIIEQFVKSMPDMDFKFYDDHVKVSGSLAIWQTEFDTETRLKMGDDVVIDSFSLSKCLCVIGKSSNLITHARIQNPKLDVIYLEKKLNLSFR